MSDDLGSGHDIHQEAEEIARRLFGAEEPANEETRQTVRLSLATGMAVGQWRHAIASLIASGMSSQQMMERILAATASSGDTRYHGLRRAIERDLAAIKEVTALLNRLYPHIGGKNQ